MRLASFVYTVGRTFEMKMTRIAKGEMPFKNGGFRFAMASIAALCILGCLGAQAAPSPAPVASPVVEGKEGWLFFEPELRFLSFPCFWGQAAQETARASKPENADPLPAIVDFQRQLAERGIALFVVPVPPKAWSPAHAPERALAGRSANALGAFYKKLEAEGVKVVDLRPAFQEREQAGEEMYCKTDSHWSGAGCVTAAEAVAKALAESGLSLSPSTVQDQWTTIQMRGDLLDLKSAQTSENEVLRIRQISDASGAPLQPDPASPLLLLGDSHTLVFHDFLAERAGFADQLAKETGIIPDCIGTRGSGANAVRVSLLRRAAKDRGYLASKKPCSGASPPASSPRQTRAGNACH
jgi:alginate O-acetyltransferase complex protein AlgJ